jgi:hypothetical protein
LNKMLAEPDYLKAPPGWSYTDPNPFSMDGSYGRRWSAFCLEEREDDQLFTGQTGQGPFSARFGRSVPHLKRRLADFLLYENSQGRTVILSFPAGIEVDAFVHQALASAPPADQPRPEDPAVVVHSTSRLSWEGIRAAGELRAASQLEGRPRPAHPSDPLDPLTAYLQHEPLEYPDFIMFGEVHSSGPELVVASYQTGQFVMDD